MKIASWNVNSIRVRLPQLLDFLKEQQIDIIALQETKCVDELFPLDAFESIGYQALYTGQKSYNGVAILSKKTLQPYPVSGYLDNKEQIRVLSAEYSDYLVVNVYVPNGQEIGCDKYVFKLTWLRALVDYLVEVKNKFKKVIVLGDFNIAPTDLDHPFDNPSKESIMISGVERQAFSQLIALGLHDGFRLFNEEPKQYTWWDYRTRGFERNIGYRIDHILVSDDVVPYCVSCEVERSLRGLDKPSDHAPIVLTLNDN